MITKNKLNRTSFIGRGLLVFAVLISATGAYSHGGKHAENEFTHLRALQKATELYDRLIEDGKLEQKWETDLQNVTIANRKQNDENELVVAFHRPDGDPKTVYIFFNLEGKYTGSNFTGK